ncbi:MAG: mechanosensitive ion channel [Ardenticatenaceae bacterium]|nr:mechanosensitive ion channel [Ardenticatenaceae bacterium]
MDWFPFSLPQALQIQIAIALVGLVVIVIVFGLVRRLTARRLVDVHTRYRVRKAITFAGYLVTGLFLAIVFSDQLSGITAALGIAGAGIAFALQEVIVSVAGWVAIAFGDFYKVGERVELGGIQGDVIDVGILRTTLMECGQWVGGSSYNGRIVRVANSFVFKEPVFNYSSDFPFLWDEITLPVKFGSDRDLARRILQQVAQELLTDYATEAQSTWNKMTRKFMIEKARVQPSVMMAANDNWLAFTLRYVVDYRQRRVMKDKLFNDILDELEATNGRVALASATFELVAAPSLDVRFREQQK